MWNGGIKLLTLALSCIKGCRHCRKCIYIQVTWREVIAQASSVPSFMGRPQVQGGGKKIAHVALFLLVCLWVICGTMQCFKNLEKWLGVSTCIGCNAVISTELIRFSMCNFRICQGPSFFFSGTIPWTLKHQWIKNKYWYWCMICAFTNKQIWNGKWHGVRISC